MEWPLSEWMVSSERFFVLIAARPVKTSVASCTVRCIRDRLLAAVVTGSMPTVVTCISTAQSKTLRKQNRSYGNTPLFKFHVGRTSSSSVTFTGNVCCKAETKATNIRERQM